MAQPGFLFKALFPGTADRHRAAAKTEVVALFAGSVEGVHVDVDNPSQGSQRYKGTHRRCLAPPWTRLPQPDLVSG